jgi:heterodisulfide reductase subunit A2
MKQRIGVYICHCGGNISDYVDVDQAAKLVEIDESVIVSKHVMFACADSTQNEMIDDIKEKKLDAIVVASCSPKLHLHTFRNVAIRAGINQYNYVQVNLREQCSWAHSDKPKEATYKGIGLIRAGINRVKHSEALENIKVDVTKSVLIVGAGVAGMQAAISLAKMGNEVILIEKDFFVGGRVSQAGELFITKQNGKEVITRLYNELKKLTNITLFTGATIQKQSGSLGNFEIEIKIEPRYLTDEYDKERIHLAIKDCPVSIPCEFDYGLTNRKAVYKKYKEALPDIPVVDKEAIKDEKTFLRKYSVCIDLEQKPEIVNVKVGAILVTTGFDPYLPSKNEYGWESSDNVVTLPKFKRFVEKSEKKLIYNGKEIKKVAFIYCVGSRQTNGPNRYCSRFCCTAAIHSSLQLHEKFSDMKIFHLYRDLRTYGKQEMEYDQASRLGDIFIKFDEEEPPVVQQYNGKALIQAIDTLTYSRELEFEVDLVVLVTGMVARKDSSELADILKIPIGNDSFFNEIHPKLRPVETVINGVYIGGTCQGPKSISSSIQSSMSGAAKINSIIRKDSIEVEPIVAQVNPDKCEWCDECSKVCEYDAINKIEKDGKTVAEVNESICTGCGVCAPVCPKDAIEITNYTDDEIFGMVDGFSQEIELLGGEKADDSETVKSTILMKEFPENWHTILKTIKDEPKTIPQIAKETGMVNKHVTYEIMTMNKYNIVESTGVDDDDEYFLFKANTED